MIAFIKGTVDSLSEGKMILESHGIGYELNIPASMFDAGVREGEELKIYTHMSVREDGISLFGFLSREDLEIYRMLIGVSGIGPKAALAVLSSPSLRASAGSEYSVPRRPDAVSNGLRREAKGWRAAMDDGEAMGILLTWDDGLCTKWQRSDRELLAIFVLDPTRWLATARPGLAGGGVTVFRSDLGARCGGRACSTASGKHVLGRQLELGYECANLGNGVVQSGLAGFADLQVQGFTLFEQLIVRDGHGDIGIVMK